jgi:class 3 adenylate cyclase
MPELPAGTVTFLYTDIEGSAPLWEREPSQMRMALARHDAILRAAIIEQGGRLPRTAMIMPKRARGLKRLFRYFGRRWRRLMSRWS